MAKKKNSGQIKSHGMCHLKRQMSVQFKLFFLQEGEIGEKTGQKVVLLPDHTGDCYTVPKSTKA
jgi:hypothetical protein